jgi:hypothetical protein
MSLAKKLNLKAGAKLRVLGKPREVDLGDVEVTSLANVKDVLMFVTRIADLDRVAAPMIEAAHADRIAWAAYPKAGQLGRTLNRDILAKELQKRGGAAGAAGGDRRRVERAPVQTSMTRSGFIDVPCSPG